MFPLCPRIGCLDACSTSYGLLSNTYIEPNGCRWIPGDSGLLVPNAPRPPTGNDIEDRLSRGENVIYMGGGSIATGCFDKEEQAFKTNAKFWGLFNCNDPNNPLRNDCFVKPLSQWINTIAGLSTDGKMKPANSRWYLRQPPGDNE